MYSDGDDDDDTKGDDNKASADPGNMNNLGDEIGERIGEGSDQTVTPI